MKKTGSLVILVFFTLLIPAVTSATPQIHPFLLFHDISEVPGYQYRTVDPWKGWEASIISSADASLRRNFSQNLGPYADDVDYRGALARDLGIAYQITKKPEYAQKAKEALLLMEVGYVGNDSYEYTNRARALGGYSLAYDWIQPTLDPATDSVIRDKLATMADTVYKNQNATGVRLGDFSVSQQGQSYPLLGVASAVLYDYTNPNHLALSTGPSDWHRAGREYLFENDKLHNYGRPLLSVGFDPASGKYLNGAYKQYVMDELALWFQVSNHTYGENLLDTYPAAKKAMTTEEWESLPNDYSDNYVTSGNTEWVYQKAIVSLLPDNEKSPVLNHIDRIENSNLLPYSGVSAGGAQGGIPPALFYCVYGNYAAIPRTFPANTSHLDPHAVTQLFRGSWNDDADWLSLITFNASTGSMRDMAHHDQLSFEYYSRGDLLLADGGEEKYVLDSTYGTLSPSHNTVAIENPRTPFTVSPYTGSAALGIYKGNAARMITPSTVDTIIQTPWMQAVQSHVSITTLSRGITLFNSYSDLLPLSSPIQYSRAVLYPDSDYFIIVDRMEGTEAWTYNNIFRPSSLMVTPTTDANKDGVYSDSEVGHVNGALTIGSTSYNWLTLPYKTPTPTGQTTSTISWATTNPYGNNVKLDLVSAPASDVLVTKYVGRIGGYSAQSEVFNPVVYLRSPPATSLYRVTALLSRYDTEAVKAAGPIPVQGNGNALVVQTPLYDDYVYTGTGNSSFNRFSTDADTVFIRLHRDKTEITLLNGSYLAFQNDRWIDLPDKTDYLTIRTDGNSTEYNISGNQKVRGSLFPETIDTEKNFMTPDVPKEKSAPQNIFLTTFFGVSLSLAGWHFLKKG
jgi:hypothetical protein